MDYKIESIINGIIDIEGGYVNDPKDSGGETNFGITKATAKAHGYHGEMIYLTREQAFEIYASDYVYGPRFDEIAYLLPLTGAELVDTGVNMGPSVAAKSLQRWLTALNNGGDLYPDLNADGIIGPRTISAIKSLIAKRGESAADEALCMACNCLQGARYLELAEKSEKNERFLWGWLTNRVMK